LYRTVKYCLTKTEIAAIFTVRLNNGDIMTDDQTPSDPKFGAIKTADELGQLLRSHRKDQQLTLEKFSGLSNLSTKFLSELERGKDTAELGKALLALRRIGLEIIIQPRGYQGNKYPPPKDQNNDT